MLTGNVRSPWVAVERKNISTEATFSNIWSLNASSRVDKCRYRALAEQPTLDETKPKPKWHMSATAARKQAIWGAEFNEFTVYQSRYETTRNWNQAQQPRWETQLEWDRTQPPRAMEVSLQTRTMALKWFCGGWDSGEVESTAGSGESWRRSGGRQF